ncbi:MAG TPA: chemotaxis protein CheW [Nitrococcus sp.]|nr:chemotaxis protein CheW [Nitrococcus sp.]
MSERVEAAISQWVTFTLDDEIYGIDVMQVQEVLSMPDITPVPGAPDWIMGIINLRGHVVTVIDTRLRLGIRSRALNASSQVIVLEAGQVVGIAVDSVAEVAAIGDPQIGSAPDIGSPEAARYIRGVVNRDNRLLILLDSLRLLGQGEWDRTAAL